MGFPERVIMDVLEEGNGNRCTFQRKWFLAKGFVALIHDTNLSLYIFPECVARVPVSLWGSGGGGCVRLTLCSRPATFRNRPQPSA